MNIIFIEFSFEFRYFQWQYISVVYSDSDYGNTGFESLQVLAGRAHICFATQHRVNVETFKDSHYDDILDSLLREKATGKVIKNKSFSLVILRRYMFLNRNFSLYLI